MSLVTVLTNMNNSFITLLHNFFTQHDFNNVLVNAKININNINVVQ